jgi:AcrR family transcriptional regulator
LTDASVNMKGPRVARMVNKQEKAERIGAAAIEQMRQLGYHRARMADIARAADVGKGTLYEYFRNKEEILRFEFDRYFAAFEAAAAAAMARASSPAAQLLELVRYAFQHLHEWESHCAVYVDYFGSARADDGASFSLAPIYGDVERRIRMLIQQGKAAGEIGTDVDEAATAELLVSVFDGVVLHGVFVGRPDGTHALLGAALRLVERGILVHEGAPPSAQGAD